MKEIVTVSLDKKLLDKIDVIANKKLLTRSKTVTIILESVINNIKVKHDFKKQIKQNVKKIIEI